MDDNSPVIIRTCIYCNSPIAEHAQFCTTCGGLQEKEFVEKNEKQGYWLTSMAVFFCLDLIIILIWHYAENLQSVNTLFVVDAILACIAIIWFVIMRKHLWPILRWNNFSLGKLVLYSILAIAASMVVNVIVTWMNRSFFDSDVNYYDMFRDLSYGKIITILVVAVQPALVEELSYRGIMQEGLSKVIDRRQSMIVTAFLFCILHLSFISLFWMLPFALILGHIRDKENTLWYGVVIHFFFNATACVLEFF